MDQTRRIAIDGPAGSGKSTIGEQLALRLGYLYLDTGAMYRALTWLVLQEGADIQNGPALAKLAQEARIEILPPYPADGRQYTVLVRGEDITWAIRETAVTRTVAMVSSHPGVRAILRARQRELSRAGKIVVVGRDIGLVVLPDAEYKIYLTASLEERARRRYAELAVLSPHLPAPTTTLEEIVKDICRRDEIDDDKMRPAHDAIVIMTDNLSVPQVLEVICSYLEEPK